MIGWRVARNGMGHEIDRCTADRTGVGAKVRLEMEDVNLIGRQGCLEYREGGEDLDWTAAQAET